MKLTRKVRLYKIADWQLKFVYDELTNERLALSANDPVDPDLYRLLKAVEKPRAILAGLLLQAQRELDSLAPQEPIP